MARVTHCARLPDNQMAAANCPPLPRVPPYYALILRSLTVLEGLALTADPNYKLLARAYPYMARRLLTDPAPELRCGSCLSYSGAQGLNAIISFLFLAAGMGISVVGVATAQHPGTQAQVRPLLEV
jgi:hypothetical protein